MTAGRRDQLISIHRATTGTDAYGEETQTWAEFAQEWAQVFYGKGDERRQAAKELGQQTATFLVLANNDTRTVAVEDRIVGAGSIWDIVGVAPMNSAEIEFTATRAL